MEQSEDALAILDRAARMQSCTGLFAARAEVLQARVGLARGSPRPAVLREILDRAIERFEMLGAPRERALAKLTYARAVAADKADSPTRWLVRAQPLLMKVGTARDLRLLRQGFRELSPHPGKWRGDAACPVPGLRGRGCSHLARARQRSAAGSKGRRHPGALHLLADRGTLLLDEIGDLPLEMQVKLLRVLQERVLHRLGGTRDIPLLARVVATTHRDLERAVAEGTFRLDLFHRLRVVHLRLPALRERRGDIPRMVDHHLRRYASRFHRRCIQVAPHVTTALEAYHCKGNVAKAAKALGVAKGTFYSAGLRSDVRAIRSARGAARCGAGARAGA